jgi:glycosyltransferase involved in cell wall biosynthesis
MQKTEMQTGLPPGRRALNTSLPKIWFEVEDIVRFLETGRHPTGIQRAAIEIICAASQLYPQRIGLCRIDQNLSFARDADIECLIDGRSNAEGGWFAHVFRNSARFVRTVLAAPSRQRVFEISLRSGDFIVTLGAPWWPNKRYNRTIQKFRSSHAIRYAVLVHDIIALTHAKYFERSHFEIFGRWFEEAANTADVVITSSLHVQAEIEARQQAVNGRLLRFARIVFGAGFGLAADKVGAVQSVPAEPYVLFVSTLEIRKNHKLLLAVWRSLLAKHGVARTPVLVFAGRRGWMIDDIVADMEASDFLGGKIIWLQDQTDEEIAELYKNCLFTVFPSFTEGWGLPVAESLMMGKLCLASSAGSIPEVGGSFCDYFAPDDFNGCLHAIERAAYDTGYRAARTASLVQTYKPALWRDTAVQLIDALDALDAQVNSAPQQK